MRGVILVAAAALCVACGSSGSGGAGGGSGGAGGGSGGAGGSGGGSTVMQPMACTPAGAMTRPADVSSASLSLMYGSSTIVAPGSDLAGSLTSYSQFRFGLSPAAMNDPPHTELSMFVNGCSIGKLGGAGEEYFWTSQAADMDQRVESGRFVVVEVVRAGQGVVMRRSFAMPAAMPQLTSPMKNAALSPPIALSWPPLGLGAIAGATTTGLRATGWIVGAGGSGRTDGSMMLDDAAGQATWNDGKSTWTSIVLTATVGYGSGVSFYLSHFVPVN